MSKKKVKKPKKSKSKVYLELDGSVNIVEDKNGVKSRTPIDPDLVLKALLTIITKSVKEKN